MSGLSRREAACLAAGAAVALPVAWWAVSRYRRPSLHSRSADYSSFLRAPTPGGLGTPLVERRPANFDTFLRSSGPKDYSIADGRPAVVGEPPQDGVELGDEDVQLLVMFGTEYGFSKEVAEKAACELRTGEYKPKLIDMADYPEGYPLVQEQVVLMVCSTQGDGVPPSEARPFVDWLDVSEPELQQVRFSVLALGDRSYTHFAACGKRIDSALERLGGRRLHDRVDVHMEDWAAINKWIGGVRETLPLLGLKPTKALGSSAGEVIRALKPVKRRYGRSNPFMATVTKVQGLCNLLKPGGKNTIQIELDLETEDTGITYVPGDALGVMPLNSDNAVKELVDILGVDGNQGVAAPSWHWDPEAAGRAMPLSKALQVCYDLRSPKPMLLKKLLDCMAAGDGQRSHLQRLVDGLDEQNAGKPTPTELYLEERHVIDILQDFNSAKLPLEDALACLRPLQPRLYSISSSPLEAPNRVQVTVAIVRYEVLGKHRIGVASTYLGERTQVGDKVAVYTSKNPDFRLPSRCEVPIIMVGPGTGLAPFRAFVQQRVHEAKQGRGCNFGPALLFFGCRHRNQDYLYGDMLEAWSKDGTITLHTAFSREGKEKVYVQHRIAEQGEAVWKLLEQGAHFYVCGDATRMAGDVEDALLEVIAARTAGGREGAVQYLEDMKAADRYQRDVWFS